MHSALFSTDIHAALQDCTLKTDIMLKRYSTPESHCKRLRITAQNIGAFGSCCMASQMRYRVSTVESAAQRHCWSSDQHIFQCQHPHTTLCMHTSTVTTIKRLECHTCILQGLSTWLHAGCCHVFLWPPSRDAVISPLVLGSLARYQSTSASGQRKQDGSSRHEAKATVVITQNVPGVLPESSKRDV
jgi:hypothetical protein